MCIIYFLIGLVHLVMVLISFFSFSFGAMCVFELIFRSRHGYTRDTYTTLAVLSLSTGVVSSIIASILG